MKPKYTPSKGAPKGEGKPLQRMPSKLEREAKPNRNNGDAIAMRRIVVEMGYWLSPLLKDHPLPVLTEWERTVDLSKLEGNGNRNRDANRAYERSKNSESHTDE